MIPSQHIRIKPICHHQSCWPTGTSWSKSRISSFLFIIFLFLMIFSHLIFVSFQKSLQLLAVITLQRSIHVILFQLVHHFCFLPLTKTITFWSTGVIIISCVFFPVSIVLFHSCCPFTNLFFCIYLWISANEDKLWKRQKRLGKWRWNILRVCFFFFLDKMGCINNEPISLKMKQLLCASAWKQTGTTVKIMFKMKKQKVFITSFIKEKTLT